MKLTLDKTLSLVSISVLGALGTLPANATIQEQAYEIINLEDAEVKGTLKGTQRAYGMGVNAAGQMIGLSQGRPALPPREDNDPVVDVTGGIAPELAVAPSISTPLVANNFTSKLNADPAGVNGVEFDSLGGSVAPDVTPANSIQAAVYGINAAGIKVGEVSSAQKSMEYTGGTEEKPEQKTGYYRDFEQRGIVTLPTGEVELPPPFTTYIYQPKDTAKAPIPVNLGGRSVAAAINAAGLVAGYGTTAMNTNGEAAIDSCFAEGQTLPLPLCVQIKQFNGEDGYQVRAMVWNTNNAQPLEAKTLPLGLVPPEDSTTTYLAQGFGINSEGSVAGHSHIEDRTDLHAAYWQLTDPADPASDYGFHAVPFGSQTEYSSMANDINDDGLLVGSYRTNISGYFPTKFFVFDTKSGEVAITPNDFYDYTSDLSSSPSDINNQGLVVGSVEISHDQFNSRERAAFLYDTGSHSGTEAFIDLNTVLTCESKGLVPHGENQWQRQRISAVDGSGKTYEYERVIKLIEAKSITDDGMYIAGTALVNYPLFELDGSNNMVIGENGRPMFVLNADGQPLTGFVPTAVLLKQSNQAVCDYVEPEPPYERQGGAWGWGLLLLTPLAMLRRRAVKRELA